MATALLWSLPALAGAQTIAVDMKPVKATPGLSVVVAKFARKNPEPDAAGAYAFVDARSVAGAPLPATISVTLPSAPKATNRPVIMVIVASPSGTLSAREILVARKDIACAPLDWFAENGLTTGPGAIITFPPKDICFPVR